MQKNAGEKVEEFFCGMKMFSCGTMGLLTRCKKPQSINIEFAPLVRPIELLQKKRTRIQFFAVAKYLHIDYDDELPQRVNLDVIT